MRIIKDISASRNTSRDVFFCFSSPTNFGRKDEDLISAAMFGGLSWSQRGKTFGPEYIGILADLLALKNRDIKVEYTTVEEYVDTRDAIDACEEKPGVYVIYDPNSGLIVRIGQTTNLAERFESHMEALEFKYAF